MSATEDELSASRSPLRRPGTPASRIGSVGSLPAVAAVLVTLNCLYITIVALGNITDYGSNQVFVQHVLAMDTTNFGAAPGTGLDPQVMWRAITTPWVQELAYLFVILWEVATTVVLLVAVVHWLRERGQGFPRARALSTVGLLMLIILFTGGFIAVGGEWFAMYRSADWNGLEPAFRISVLALAAIIIIHLPSPCWTVRQSATSETNATPSGTRIERKVPALKDST